MSSDRIIEYVGNWKSIPNIKPMNEPEFIELFLEFIADGDNLNIKFDGDGAYFGKQVSITRRFSFGYDILAMEIAYDSDQIAVYDGNNNGYWTPEYIHVTPNHPEFNKIKQAIFELLTTVFGLKQLV